MTEGVFKSFDPLTYWVNDVGNLDKQIVKAYKSNDSKRIDEIISNGNPHSFDVFICSDGFHAFLLLIPAIDEPPVFGPNVMGSDAFDVPDLLCCWRIELQYEEVKLQTYQITKNFVLFRDVKADIKRPFHIARYENVKHVKCFDLACLRAAPHRYNAILKDCVEFAKEFCMCLLSYCANARNIEKNVISQLKKITATGLSLEKLSRNSFLSGLLGNISLGGLNMGSFLSGPKSAIAIFLIIFFLFIYPIFVACIVYYIMNSQGFKC